MAAKIPAKALIKAVEEAAEKGGKYATKAERMIAEATKEAKEALRKYLEGDVKPPKPPKPSASMPSQARKPAPPPSQPRPTLEQEPAPTTAPKPQPKTKTSPGVPTKVPKKREEEKESDEPGLVKIADVFEAVNRVMAEDHPWLELAFSILPFPVPKIVVDKKILDNPDVPRDATGSIILTSDGDKATVIKAVVKSKRLDWKHKRKAERLKTPGVFPGGEVKRYINRRLDGAGYKAKVKRITLFAPYGGTITLVAVDPNNPTEDEINTGIAAALGKADRAMAKQQRAAQDARRARAQTA